MASPYLSENCGEISSKGTPSIYVEWKVQVKDLLSRDNEHRIYSPSFQLNDVTLHLGVTIHEGKFKYHRGMNGPVDICLLRKGSNPSSLPVYFCMGIRKADGDPYYSFEGDFAFEADGDWMQKPELLSRFDITEEKNSLAPNGEVTFFCRILVTKTESDEHLSETGENLRMSICEDNEVSVEECRGSGEGSQEKTLKDVNLNRGLPCSGLSKLGTDMKNLFVNGQSSDMIITVQNKQFKAHQCIIRARSPVFSRKHAEAINSGRTVDIDDCFPEAFELFLLYLYSGNMENLSTNTVCDLYGTANKYGVEELRFQCERFILDSLSVDTVCDVLELVIKCDEMDLRRTAEGFFMKNYRNVILTSKWRSFLRKHPGTAGILLKDAEKYYGF